MRIANDMKFGAKVDARLRMKPIGMANSSVFRRPLVSAHKPQPYDERITPEK